MQFEQRASIFASSYAFHSLRNLSILDSTTQALCRSSALTHEDRERKKDLKPKTLPITFILSGSMHSRLPEFFEVRIECMLFSKSILPISIIPISITPSRSRHD